jgi:hypothetical protein
MNTEQDPLLADLQGDPTLRGEQPDGPLPGDTTGIPEDPLDVRPKAAVSPVKAMDAKHSLAAGGKGYRVVVAGDYYSKSKDPGRKADLARYELEFNLPSLDRALSLIVGKLLMPALVKKHPDAIRYRTHEIRSARPLSPETPESTNLQFMPFPGLQKFAREEHVPIDLKDPVYQDEKTLRVTLVDYVLNPKDFEKREALRREERKELAELAAMNPDLGL